MEENGGLKAPVTRLRRRLSVEQTDDTMSPSTPSTPTKKRASRLAAKPQLELIDENSQQITPKKAARRSMARDVLEPVEEKPATPARRSARVKSNTSLVLELEAVQNLDSPRAKRAAARRNSQIGSDNEAPITTTITRRTRKNSTSSVEILAIETPVTPGRTRRTRKDSASSDMQGENAPASIPHITEVISEEPEIEHQKTTISVTPDESKDQNSSPNSPRKSPRIKAKIDRKVNAIKSDNENIHTTPNNKSDTTIKNKSESNEAIKTSESGDTAKLEDNSAEKNKSIDLHKEKLSTCSVNLVKIKNSDSKPKIKYFRMNKSTSAVDHSNNSESKRRRIKSWNTLTVPLSTDNIFFSDNENTKKKIKKNELALDMRFLNQAGSSNSEPTREYIDESEKTTTGKEKSSSKKKKKRNENSFNTGNNKTVTDSSNANKSNKFDVSVIETETAVGNVSNESNKENVEEINSGTHKSNVAQILFQNPVNTFIKSTVFIEDSDTDSLGRSNKQLEGEDQCVPVVDHQMKNQETINLENQVFANFNASEQNVTNTCEPMDIDETIPDNIIINDSSTENLGMNQMEEKGSRKSSLCIPQTAVENIANEGSNKSKRKSFISNSIIQDVDKTGNESKSTLVLSQIKDTSISSAGHNESKSFNELLSKSLNLPNVAKDEINKNNLSLNYLTSTPVHQKDFKKLGMQMNTSVIAPCNEGKKEAIDTKHSSMKELSKTSNNSDSSEEEIESSKEKNDLVDDEAVDAGDDYESGDSQDEEEKQYEKDHEILEKGETLTSEDEISNDSDYEKDSFLVSSDEEDDDLLSGSGDDLDMSVNELTMSAKSKMKFNERSIKKQKSASKEMFEARHKMNASDRSSKEKQSKINNKRRRLDSLLLESEDDNPLPPKKNKRMRLDSKLECMTKSEDEEDVHEDKNTSEAESDTSEIGLKKKKKVNRLSDSICDSEVNEKEVEGDSEMKEETKPKKKKKDKRSSESVHNESVFSEKEITICDNTIGNDDPLLTAVKREPKTPNKDLEISTIQFTTREDIEQVNIDQNTSIMKSNMSLDPLMATMAPESEDESSLNEEGFDSNNEEEASSISENEEITNNYDSILNELNKEMKSKHIKTDTSLNLNKKTKEKAKEPIIAELNITETKNKRSKVKPKKINSELEVSGNKLKSVVKKIANSSDDDSTSNSIQLRLLFSEDSNDSSKSNGDSEVEHFIPLKRTEGKTNILRSDRASMNANELEDKETTSKVNSKKKNKKLNLSKDDISTANTSKVVDEALLNTSANKKSKMPKYMQNEENIISNDSENVNHDTSLNSSSKKKNKKRKSSLNENGATLSTSEIVNEPLLNTSSKNNNKVVQSTQNEDSAAANDSENVNHDTSLNSSSKKKNKKLKSSLNEDGATLSSNEIVNESLLNTSSKNKNKMMQSTQNEDGAVANATEIVGSESLKGSSDKKNKKRKLSQNKDDAPKNETTGDVLNFFVDTMGTRMECATTVYDSLNTSPKRKEKLVYDANDDKPVEEPIKKIVSKKRKERDDDDGVTKSKILKQSSFDEIIPRLPATIINNLERKRRTVYEVKKTKIVSTTEFSVDDNRRKNKPSNFLEQTVYMNTNTESTDVKKTVHFAKPKVLPFIPTASTSHSGFTTNFKVNVIPREVEFVAQSSDVTNFKNDYLINKKIKKLRTYELYRQHRNVKLSKF